MTTATQAGFLEMAAHDGRAFVSITRPAPDFGGITYDRARDQARLTGQLAATFEALSDGHEWALPDLADSVSARSGRHASEASVSARIRDLRKAKFGGHQVARRNAGGGLWYYRMVLP